MLFQEIKVRDNYTKLLWPSVAPQQYACVTIYAHGAASLCCFCVWV